MKRLLTTWLPFAAIAAVALWWLGALDLFSASTTQPTEQTNAPAPHSDATAGDEKIRVNADLASHAPWPIYHGNTALTGAVDVTLPVPLTRMWSFQAQGPVYSPPVASSEAIFFNTSNGWIVALDAQGVELWSKQLMRTPRSGGDPVPERFEAPLACFGGLVYLGSSYGTLYALEASTGVTRWTFDVGGTVLGTVNVQESASEGDVDRLVVIDQNDGALQCLDAATGEPLWRTESIDRCDGSPSVGEDVIVFGSCAAALHIFSAEDGTFLRNIELDGDSQVAGGVALDAGMAFSGSHSGRLFHVDTEKGEIVWINEDSADEVFTTPAVNMNWVVFGSLDGAIHALNRTTGKTVWSFETPGEPSSPVIASEKVLFSSDGTLYLLDLETGEELWSYAVGDAISGPAIIGGMVIVGGDDGIVTAFG